MWVENVGHGTLFVEAPYFAEDSAFSISGETVALERMEAHAYDVTFDPQVPFVHSGGLVFESNDPKGRLRTVGVSGEGFAPVLEMVTSPIDLGTAPIGCRVVEEIEVRNGGNEVLVVTPSLDGTSLTEVSLADGTDPIGIAPSMAATIRVAYQPLDTIADAATLTLETNDPILPQPVIEVTGVGRELDTQSDVFEVGPRESDIVLIVDNSSSMHTELEPLVEHIGTFVETLDDAAVDYRIGVITTDQDSFRGPVVRPGDPLEWLADQVDVIEGSGTERGLQMLYNCVQAGADCSAVVGFLRDDALFVGVIISDDPDQSALSPEAYVEHFWTLKDDPELVRIHAVAGAIPIPTCSTCASAGFGYDEAVELTYGGYYDICDSMSDTLSGVADQSVVGPVRSLELSEDPIAGSIDVSVDGLPWVAGWAYTGHVADGGTNEVEFDDPLPIRSVVEVSYTVTVACD